MKYLERILFYASVFSVLIPLFAAIVFYKRLDANSRIMLVLLIPASVAQLASLLPDRYAVYPFFNAYCILDSAIWGYMFYRNSRNRWIRNSIVVLISSQILVAFFTYIQVGISTRFFGEFVCLSALLQVLWVLSFFYERYKREEIQALEKEPMFWFCLGILIYEPATYFRFAFYERLGDKDYFLKSLHSLSNTAMYLLFAVGILANVLRNSKLQNVFVRNKS